MSVNATTDPAAGMTREMRDRAVAVMKDVLDQLAANRLNVASGSGYFIVSCDAVKVPEDVGGLNLRDVLGDIQPHCQVCMLGACLISKARVYDEVPLSKVVCQFGAISAYYAYRDTLVDILADVFTTTQLDLLEAAFEETLEFAQGPETDIWFLCGAAVYGRSFGTAEARCRAIAENVIANDGVFVVDPVSPDDYDSLDDDDDDDAWDQEEDFDDDEDEE